MDASGASEGGEAAVRGPHGLEAGLTAYGDLASPPTWQTGCSTHDDAGGPGEYTHRDTLRDVAGYLDPRRSLRADASGWIDRPGSQRQGAVPDRYTLQELAGAAVYADQPVPHPVLWIVVNARTGAASGDTQIAAPLLKIDPGASTALDRLVSLRRWAHTALCKASARACAGVRCPSRIPRTPDAHTGLLEHRIETTAAVVSILMG
jgi:hypothetical protein